VDADYSKILVLRSILLKSAFSATGFTEVDFVCICGK